MALCEPRVIFDASPRWPASGHRFNRRHAYRISHALLQAANKLFNSRARLARGADLAARDDGFVAPDGITPIVQPDDILDVSGQSGRLRGRPPAPCRRLPSDCPCGSASASGRRHSPPPRRPADRPSRWFQLRRSGPAGQPPDPDSAAPARQLGCSQRPGEVLPPPSADPWKAHRKDRDWTVPTAPRARSSTRWRSNSALRHGGPVDRAWFLAPKEFANRDYRANGRG